MRTHDNFAVYFEHVLRDLEYRGLGSILVNYIYIYIYMYIGVNVYNKFQKIKAMKKKKKFTRDCKILRA